MVRVGIEQDIGGSAERIVVIDVETVDPTPLDPAAEPGRRMVVGRLYVEDILFHRRNLASRLIDPRHDPAGPELIDEPNVLTIHVRIGTGESQSFQRHPTPTEFDTTILGLLRIDGEIAGRRRRDRHTLRNDFVFKEGPEPDRFDPEGGRQLRVGADFDIEVLLRLDVIVEAGIAVQAHRHIAELRDAIPHGCTRPDVRPLVQPVGEGDVGSPVVERPVDADGAGERAGRGRRGKIVDEAGDIRAFITCLLYTSDAADERSSVDLGGRRIIKKKKSIRRDGRSNNQQ